MSEKGKLSKALLYAPENGFDRLPEGEKAAMHDYCESYKDFLNPSSRPIAKARSILCGSCP